MLTTCAVSALCVVVLAAGAVACSDEQSAPASSSTTPTPTGPAARLPPGVTLTEAGSSIQLGDPASVLYPEGKGVSVLTVNVSKVVTGSIKDFQSFRMSPQQRRSTPYYVRATVTNDGSRPLGRIDVPLYALDTTDTAFPATTVLGSFDRCSGATLPSELSPHDTLKACLIYLVPAKATLQAVQLRTSEDAEAISWPVT